MTLKTAIVLTVASPVLATVALTTLIAGPAEAHHDQDAPKHTWSGIYTADQAKRGEAAYAKSCGSCHAPDLAGDVAPSLTGAEFSAGWNDQSAQDLADRIQTTMPADGPGTLSRQQAVDITAYIFSKDGFPSGDTELPIDVAVLKQIKILTRKP